MPWIPRSDEHTHEEHHMNSLNQDLARAVMDARLAAAHQRHLARLAKDTRPDTRPVEPPLVRGTRRRRWFRRRLVRRAPSTAAAPEHWPAGIEGILDRTAQRVVANGTRTEAHILCAMSAAARRLSPGASAALVDWAAPEPVRLRAFGIVHVVVLRDLDASGRARLLDQLTRTARAEARGLTAVAPPLSTASEDPSSEGVAAADLPSEILPSADLPSDDLPSDGRTAGVRGDRGEAA